MASMTLAEVNPDIEINDDFKKAIDLINDGASPLLITGKAGTGKSTFLDYYRNNIKKDVVVLAPTGVAAVNVKGQTIHSFFHFKPDITVKAVSTVKVEPAMAKVYKRLKLIIIDEVSMVRADLMDCIDRFLRLHGPDAHKPFGGVQMIFIGDLYQLAPVVPPDELYLFRTVYQSPYFFDAHVFNSQRVMNIEFLKNYRQSDSGFIELLDAIRGNCVSPEHLDRINSRYVPDFEPERDDFYVYLTTTNKLADQINVACLNELNEELFTYEGKTRGDFTTRNLPALEEINLKEGCRVMLLNNDPEGRWVNGSMGVVKDIYNAGFNAMAVLVQLADGRRVEVEPFTWELFEFFYNVKKDAIDSRSIGSFRQFPLKLAWAITIHKSQGKTFDRVIIDVGRGAFCHGQVYVALSRCRTFQGIILKQKLTPKDIRLNEHVSRFNGTHS